MRYPTRVVGDTTLVASRIVSTVPCKLVAITGYSDGTAAFLLVCESATVPGNGASGRFTIAILAAGNFSLNLENPVDLDNCTVVASSTADTVTAVAGNHQSIQGLLAS